MTPQFTTPCYVRIDDRDKRKEVCEKLTEIGYKDTSIENLEWVLTKCESTDVDYLVEYMKISIDCGTNIPLFLDLAAMRSDTDKGQLFTKNGSALRRCNHDNMLDDETFSAHWRKATATEIIEWHNQKGETK